MTSHYSDASDLELGWVEVAALAIQVGAKAALGNAVGVSAQWVSPESAGWKGRPGAVFLAISFNRRDAASALTTYFLCPWQHISEAKEAGNHLVPLLTVTRNVMIFGPWPGPKAQEDTTLVEQSLPSVVAVALDLESNNEVRRHSLDTDLPDSLQVELVAVRSNYVSAQGRLIGGEAPDEKVLSELTPGRMLGLSLKDGTGEVTRL